MALDLKPGDEVIVPAFTYVATAEVIALLRLKPVMVDVDPDSFNITPEIIQEALTPNTKCVVPVSLFGQNPDLEGIMALAEKHKFYVVEVLHCKQSCSFLSFLNEAEESWSAEGEEDQEFAEHLRNVVVRLADIEKLPHEIRKNPNMIKLMRRLVAKQKHGTALSN